MVLFDCLILAGDVDIHLIANEIAKAATNGSMMQLMSAGMIRSGGIVHPDILPLAGGVVGGYGCALNISGNVQSLTKLGVANLGIFDAIECFNTVCEICEDGISVSSLLKCFYQLGFFSGKTIMKNSPMGKGISVGLAAYGLFKMYVKKNPDSCLKPITNVGDTCVTIRNVSNVVGWIRNLW